MLRLTTLRAAAAVAIFSAMALAGCGGGRTSSALLPDTNAGGGSGGGATIPTKSGSAPLGTLSVVVPNATSASAQSTQRAILSSSRKPAYIDTTTANSTIVVSVTPSDPAEAAQYGNLTVCYNLYTNGTLAAQNPPNFTYTATGNNASTVTIAIPAPPGTDGYQITQYAGQCGSTPYTIPTAPPTTAGASNILAQTPVTYAYMVPGATNNLNNQIANCPLQTVPCPQTTGTGPGATLVASVAVAGIQFGAFPIPDPVREQGAFLLATGKIGVPIPLEGINAAGTVIPGLTTPTNLTGGAGPVPSGVTVTSNDTTTHTALYLVDAANGAIAQAATSNATGITIHEFNALSNNTLTGLTNNCGASGTASCNDITFGGSTAAAGDPWVIVMTSDGVGPTALASVTVTATATIPPATTATTITQAITPQAAIYSAGTGYPDVAAPAAPLAMIQPVAGGPVYFTDGNTVKIDGSATVSAPTGGVLTGLTYATVTTPLLYAVDNSSVGTAGGSPSGLYAFNPSTLAVTPVTTQDGNGNPVQFAAPVGAVFAKDISGNSKLFVIDTNGIEIVDINQSNQSATNVGPLLCTGTPLAAAPSGVKLFGTVAVNTSSSTFLVADPGASRIAQVTVSSNYNCTISTYASGAAFTGLTTAGSGGALLATSTTGQIYYISGSGATPVSLGFTTGTAADGPVGQVASFTPSTTPTLAPVNYKLQFATGSFFDSANAFAGGTGSTYAALAAPYTIAPFGGTKAFAAPVAGGVGLLADTSASATPTTGVIDATGGIIVVPSTAGAAATVTPDSILFVDKAGTGGKLRTIAR